MRWRTEAYINKVAFIMVAFILWMILIVGLFWQAGYDYADFPYFERTTAINIISIIGSAVIMIIYMYIGKKSNWNLCFLFIGYVAISMLYLFFVQLEPFSDMKMVYDIACHNMRDESGYLSSCSNQIPVCIYLWILLKVFGESIMVPKLFNLLCNILICWFIYKIYLFYSDDFNSAKGIIWFSAFLIPPVLYENHIYNDVFFTMLTVIMVYFILCRKYTKMTLLLLCGIAILQYLIRPCGIIYIIAMEMYMILFRKERKKALICSVVILVGIIGISVINNQIFQVDKSEGYPVWSYIQMGINEEEFGFQDGTHSADWTWQDCVEKYRQLGWKKVVRIMIKKEVWMWTEGTYQAQRYAFGDSMAVYTHENFLTKDLRNLGGYCRSLLNLITKGQYYIYMLLALLGIKKLKYNREISLLLYIVCGMACFYLIWEIKSRYIYSLYPIFLVFSYFGWMHAIEIISHLKKISKCDIIPSMKHPIKTVRKGNSYKR
ncbi:MAG: hypothetical protein NC489_32720 [Ruminococcus flavefaciens]|nr:hypothetical protein [Ruminococcus flavefaciens]